MCKILLAINPKYVNQILTGKKKFEFRTKIAQKKVDLIIIYSTYPVKKVVAEVEVKNILAENPEVLWEQTFNYAGITKSYFESYFFNREIAYAYELGRIKKYEEPKDLIDIGCKTAPQSFVYLNA